MTDLEFITSLVILSKKRDQKFRIDFERFSPDNKISVEVFGTVYTATTLHECFKLIKETFAEFHIQTMNSWEEDPYTAHPSMGKLFLKQ